MPELALTLSEIAARGWKMRACCGACGLIVRVSVDSLVRCYGPFTVWWGRRPPCPRMHDGDFACEGRMTYQAQGGPRASWVALRAVPPETVARIKAMRAG